MSDTAREPNRAAARRAAFDAFLTAGSAGRPGAWRFVVGLIFIIVFYVGGFIASFAVVAALYSQSGGAFYDLTTQDGSGPMGARAGVLMSALAAVGATILAVALALRWVHRRSFASALGAERRIRPGAVFLGAFASIAAILATTPFAMAFDLVDLSVRTLPSFWPLLAAAVAVLVVFQASAEEIVFRGYVLQWLGARFRSPLVWAFAPSLAFGLLHISDGGAATFFTYMVMTTAFGLFAAALVWLTGGLSHAIGYHVANNLIALLVFEPPMGIDGIGAVEMSIDEADLPLIVAVNLIGMLVAFAIIARFGTPETPRPSDPPESREPPVDAA